MQFATIRKLSLMNSLTYFQQEAKRSIQKCYLPVAVSAMSNRRPDIPYFLRSFARRAKADTAAEQPLVSQNTETMVSATSSLSYATSRTYTRRDKLISTEDQCQYVLRKRIKEDKYRFIDTPTLEKHISSLSTKKEPEEIDSMDTSTTEASEVQRNELPASPENQKILDEEEKRNLKAVMISNTVNKLRRWCYTDYGRKHQQSAQLGLEFTVTSYNILAQELLEDNFWLYRRVEPEVLEWDYRSRNLIRELCSLQSDIICLQEVQSDHYESILKPNFERLGYECLYKKRTGNKGDGCAVLYRKNVFMLVKCQEVEFYKPGIPLLNRDNVGLIVLLKPHGLPSYINTHLCIATTHLLFNPRCGDVKLAQLRLLLAEIDDIAFKECCNSENKIMYHPVILCGDMNSEPFSPLYDFLCKGSLNCDSLLSGDISGQIEGANRGHILNSKELLHPKIAITESSQYSELLRHREYQGSICSTNSGKQTSSNEIQTNDQNMLHPSDCMENLSSDELKASGNSYDSPLEENAPPLPSVGPSSPASSEDSSSSSSSSLTIYHNFNFNSAYSHFCGGKHEVTTHHSKANCTVDYIFFSSQSKKQLNESAFQHNQIENGPLYHLGSYRLLNDSEMEDIGGLPNSYQSSDHLSLASKFLLKFS